MDYLRQLMEATLGGDVFTSVDYICQYNEALSAEKNLLLWTSSVSRERRYRRRRIYFCGLPASVDRGDAGGEEFSPVDFLRQ